MSDQVEFLMQLGSEFLKVSCVVVSIFPSFLQCVPLTKTDYVVNFSNLY